MQVGGASAAAADWEAVGHGTGGAWLELLGAVGASVLGLALLGLVLRAWLSRHAFRAVDVLGPGDVRIVREEVARAERRTVGEVAVVVLERSDEHPAAAWVSALATLLLGSVLLAPWLPWDWPAALIGAQLALGGLGYALARLLPGYRRAFVREERATEMAEEQALQEFHRHGLHDTAGRTGVLLFVSLLERRVVVLGDRSIDELVGPEGWAAARDAVLAGVRAGSLRDGLVEGVRAVGSVLAEHFPWQEGDRNELHDVVDVRRE